jgi:transcriptional antiterminator RfaH
MPLLPAETTLYPADLLNPDFADFRGDGTWWVIHTRPRAEKSLARKLAAAGIGFYLPTRHQRWRSNGRAFESHLPLFPGYVFVHAKPGDRAVILSTGMVANLLPVADQDELEDDLRRIHRVLSAGLPLERQEAIPPGTYVEVVDGALQGLTGTVVRTGRQAAVFIQVRLIGQGVLVEVDPRLLRPTEQLIAV